MSLERELTELLHLHDCVIVPEWGGFLTHYRPARLDEARQLIHPPTKELGFNRHLVRNDGLLADHVARKSGTDFEAATGAIADVVSAWRHQLERGGRLELPHMGIFFLDAEGNLQFDPDRRSNYLRDAYGLRPLRARSVEPKPVLTEVPVIPLLPPAAPEPAPAERSSRPLRWVAAAAAMLLLGTATYWALEQGPLGGTRWSALDPFRSEAPRYQAPAGQLPAPVLEASAFELPSSEEVVTLPLVPEENLSMTVDMRPATEPAAVDSTSVVVPRPTAIITASTGRYHIIGGCFAQPENADRKLVELQGKGFPAVRLDKRGELHPVAYGTYATRTEALEALAAVRASGEGAAWLLVR
ncbi:MAG: SPOR domain-containing protein [Flavobacteriales bacterium]